MQEHHGIRGEDIMMMRSEKYLRACIDEYVSLVDTHRELMELGGIYANMVAEQTANMVDEEVG